jgi:nucleoside-diphosphate-sugar epimerase
VTPGRLSQKLARLREGCRSLISGQALIRMLADLLSMNGSMVLAFVLWYFLYAAILGTPEPARLAYRFRGFVKGYWLIWSAMGLVIFHLHGLYSRTRGYVRRYKAVVIFRAVTLFVVSFVFADYFIYRGQLFPRGVAFLSWVFLLVSTGGSRYAKHLFLKAYHVEPKSRPQKPQKVLLVGGAGYLGAELAPQLLDRGYGVRVLDSLLFGEAPLDAVKNHADFELIAGDVRDIQSVVHAVKGCDTVIHLAAIVGDPACDENRQLAAEINRAATRMLIDVSRGHGVQRFLFASTCSVYGASDSLMDEHARVLPISLYAQTKLDSEALLLEARSAGFHPTILRLATLFGLSARPRFDLVVNLLTARAVRTGKITIFNGEQWRPFMHVSDAARAFVTCLEANHVGVVSGQVFNAGSNNMNHRLCGVAREIATIVPTVEVEHIENQDRRNYRVAFDKIHSRLGFECRRTLQQGIAEMADMVRESEIHDFSAEMFNNRAMVRTYAKSSDSARSSIRLLETLARAE